MGAIDINAVRKSYGPVEVLHSVDLAINKGEFIVLVGPSGCGKSTLLRMIAGLEDVSAGEIVIAGRRVNDLPPKDRNLAMVFQSYALYPHMTVEGNMSYALRLRKTAKERIRAAVSGAANLLGLGQLRERRPRQLSGGQRQRVAMGRAIVREPAAFLFDEPLSNLDARLREQMRAEIKKLHGRLGATSIYVTHDQIEAMTLATRIVAMDNGTIQQIGTPNELYARPANRFVAGFIGSPAMNFAEATYRNGALAIAPGAAVPVSARLPLVDGVAVTLGIRPEHVVFGEAAGASDIRASVEIVEPTGMGAIVHLALAHVALKAFHVGGIFCQAGDEVAVRLPEEHLHLFDPQTGSRVEVGAPTAPGQLSA